MLFRLAHDAALPDLTAADLKLGLYQHYDLPGIAEKHYESRQDLSNRDKRNVHHDEIEFVCKIGRLQVTCVHIFANLDPRIASELPCKLVCARIYRNDRRRA